MKLVQFWKNDKASLGIQTEQGIVDVADEAARRGITAPATMLEAIQLGDAGMQLLKQFAQIGRASCRERV